MKPVYKWYVVILLFVLARRLVDKGLELWALGTEVDGAGIGVYFLVFEINDRVAEVNIPMYAIGFFVVGGLVALAALVLAIKGLFKSNSKNILKKA